MQPKASATGTVRDSTCTARKATTAHTTDTATNPPGRTSLRPALARSGRSVAARGRAGRRGTTKAEAISTSPTPRPSPRTAPISRCLSCPRPEDADHVDPGARERLHAARHATGAHQSLALAHEQRLG